ncbi:MAG: ABC transporter permease [Bacteroidota bacterium]
MFDLDTALATWRHQFTHTRAFVEADLDEMERHLRDQVQDLVAEGRTPAEAFQKAVAEMGGLAEATGEYEKVHWRKVCQRGSVWEEVTVWRSMVGHHLKLAYRTLVRNKVPSAINVVGLAVALACCVTVYEFLVTWHAMDAYHAHGPRLLLAQHDVERNHHTESWGRMPMPLGPALEADFPQVERTVRVQWVGATVQHADQLFEETMTLADPGFFDVLTFPLAQGSATALMDPGAVIVSSRTAERYFGEADPIGQPLVFLFDGDQRRVLTVAGVAEPFPANTGFRFDFLAGLRQLETVAGLDLNDWAAMTSGLFVLVRDPADLETVAQGADRYLALQQAANPDWPIQAFGFDRFTDPSPDAQHVRGRVAEAAHPALSILFIVLALFMLALSCFNYINIALGAATHRLKEIGVRKVMGGHKRQLVLQFLTENVLLCLLALALGVLIAKALLVPVFNALFVIQLDVAFGRVGLWAFLVGLLLAVAIISGAYPALYVASFRPVSILRGPSQLGRTTWLTRSFLTFQFVLAFVTVMLGVALFLNNRYLVQQDWGYDPGQTLVVELQASSQFAPLRDAVSQHPDVRRVAGAEDHIGRSAEQATLHRPNGDTQPVLQYVGAPQYLETLGLRLAAGRLFDPDRQRDLGGAVVVNERLVRTLGWTEPLGQSVRVDSTTYTVIGVVEDFTAYYMMQPRPAVFIASEAPTQAYLVATLREGTGQDVEAFVEAAWAALFPEDVHRSFFQETVFDEAYQTYEGVAQAFGLIAGLALLIACMGLFGLASQHTTRRMKEISIRKVVGASVPQLAFLVNRGFLGLLTLAALLASAVCVLLLGVLLGFVRSNVPIDHMPLTPLPFLLAYMLVLAAAALAIGGQVTKLVRTNPAEVLRGA